MKKRILSLLGLSICVSLIFAQAVPVAKFDATTSKFDGGSPLPANQFFKIEFSAPPGASMAGVNLYPGGKMGDNSQMLGSTYVKVDGKTVQAPLVKKLSENQLYDIEINFYNDLTSGNRQKMLQHMEKSMNVFLQNFAARGMGRDDNKCLVKPKKGAKEMEEAFRRGVREFGAFSSRSFAGFSDRMKDKFEDLNQLIRIYQEQKGAMSNARMKDVARMQIMDHLAEMKALAMSEADFYLRGKFLMRIQQEKVSMYPAANPLKGK